MNASMPERSNNLKTALLTLTPWVLGLATVIVLLKNLPDNSVISSSASELAVYAVLTAFSLYFGVLLTEGELSPSHMVGILAFLSSPAAAISTMTWAVFLGSVVGAIGWFVRTQTWERPRAGRVNAGSAVMMIARVTLSFWAAGEVYIAGGGQLPLGPLPEHGGVVVLLLAIYALVYVTLYFSIFLLEIYSAGLSVRQIVRGDLSRIAVILILPIPFAILGARVLTVFEAVSRIIFIGGMVLIVVALYALSRSEFRLRKQFDELRTLSVVTRAMRSHLELDGLLRTIYLQVAHLLEVDHFQVALFDTEEQKLNFPLTIQGGQEDKSWVEQSEQPGQPEKTLLDYVLKSESPLLISERVPEHSRDLGVRPPSGYVNSWLGVPLHVGGRLLGAMVVMSRNPARKLTRDDLRLLNIVAASGGIAIENAQLYRQQKERAEQLTTLNRVSALLGGTLSPDVVLDTVISSASTISNAQAVAVYLFLEDAGLPLVRSAGLSSEFALEPAHSLLQQQYASQTQTQPAAEIVVSNVASDRRAETVRPVMQRERKAAFIELPLVNGDQLHGVLILYFDQPQIFSGEKVELFKTFTNQAAQAIVNARIYNTASEAFQRSGEQLLTLAAIGRALASTMDLQTICELILRHATEATKGEVGSVVLLDEETRAPLVAIGQGYPADAVHDTVSGLIAAMPAQVLEKGQTYRTDDVRRDNHHKPLLATTRSLLSVPILRGTSIMGAITLESQAVGAFSIEDINFVSQLANQAVIAISNARLFNNISDDRNRMQVLLDAMEEGIMLIDRQGKIVLANPRIDLIALTPAQVLNRSFKGLLDEPAFNLVEKAGFSSYQEACELVDNMGLAKMHVPVMYVLQGELGVVHIKRQIVPVNDKHGLTLGVLLVFYNKTEEQELARSREELSRMIVHDLRSPLTAVTSSLKLMKEIVPTSADHYRMVEDATDTSRRALRKLLNRIDSLLDVAKMESGQISINAEPTELSSLIENVRTELKPLTQELEITIAAQVDPRLLPLNVDSDKVERLLLNLVDNALKYSPSESTITVRHHPPGTNGAEPGYVRIDVIDQGPGIPSEYKETLFNRFVQIEGRRKVRRGVGLGLTFCRMVVEAHRGRIWIEDNAGGGSIFAFTLPIVSLEGIEDDD